MGKMRIAYLTCALLAVVIGSLGSIDAAAVKDTSADQQTTLKNSNASVPFLKDTTTPVPLLNVTNTPTSNETKSTTAEPPSTTLLPTNATTLLPTNATTILSTTASHATTKEPSPPTPTAASTTQEPSTTEPTTPTKSSSTPSPTATTAGVPVTSTSAPDSKERYFDGISFLDGIIVGTCLMLIGVFSWKICKTCKEQSYSTL